MGGPPGIDWIFGGPADVGNGFDKLPGDLDADPTGGFQASGRSEPCTPEKLCLPPHGMRQATPGMPSVQYDGRSPFRAAIDFDADGFDILRTPQGSSTPQRIMSHLRHDGGRLLAARGPNSGGARLGICGGPTDPHTSPPSSLATVTLGAHATPQSQASHDGSGIRTAIPVAVPGPSSVSVRCASAGNLASVSERRTHAPGRQVPGAGQRAGIGIGAGVVEGQRGVTMDSVDDAAPHFEAAGLLGFDQGSRMGTFVGTADRVQGARRRREAGEETGAAVQLLRRPMTCIKGGQKHGTVCLETVNKALQESTKRGQQAAASRAEAPQRSAHKRAKTVDGHVGAGDRSSVMHRVPSFQRLTPQSSGTGEEGEYRVVVMSRAKRGAGAFPGGL